MNPLWLLPAIVPTVIILVWLTGMASNTVQNSLNRLSVVLFGKRIAPNRRRERRLEAAYINTTYRTYAAKTLLFTVLGFVAGTIAGAYAVAALLAVLEPLVHTLSGLPRTITRPIGITPNFTFDPSTSTRWTLVLGGGLALGIITSVLAYVMRWQLPASTAAVRARGIEEGLPRTTAFMFALSRGGMEFPQILRTLTDNKAVYGETAREMNIAVREMDMFGRDMITALRRMARRTPSEQFKTFSENMTSILQSGSNLPTFFSDQYDRFRDEQEERQEEVLELLATIAEMYVTVLVAGMLFLITILLVFGLLIVDTFMMLVLLIYVMIPLGNAGFALILQQKLDELGIAKKGGSSLLGHLSVSTPTQSVTATDSRQSDGGYAERERENRRMLGYYDRLRRFKLWLRNPLRAFLWKPTNLLYVVVPIALLLFLVRAPAAFQAEGIAYRVLDDLIIQSALFVLISYAIVREYYKRRINRIEAALPDLLERLASLNEAGMSVVEGLRRLRSSDLGVLSPEVSRIWRDIEYGSNIDDALIRFGRRVRTLAVSRVVTLWANAMRASGDMGPVLRVAAEQARSEVKLKRQRSQKMMTYLVVIYVSFFVFLVIVIAVNEVLIPSLPDAVPTPDEEQASRAVGAAGAFDQLGEVNQAAYALVFFHGAMIQAVCAGFIAGQLGEGSLRDGAKHAAVMVAIAYVMFLLLTSPVASITLANVVTSDGQEVRGINEVSLSDGGFIAVYDEDGLDGELLGHTAYLEPGTHSNVEVPLQYGEIDRDRTIRIVAHQDTNGNEQFDFRPPRVPGEDQPDGPYESVADSDQPGIEVDVLFEG